MTAMPPRMISGRAHRREISSSFLRAFTPLGWACWLVALASAAYLSWTLARLCVVWMAA